MVWNFAILFWWICVSICSCVSGFGYALCSSKNLIHTIGVNMKSENSTKIIVEKPEEMELAKWEKIIIKLTQNFRPLGVTVRRLSDGKNISK